jgi:purine-binding chemotaxis protein CheW
VIDVRGQVVPVIDLRGRFGLPARPVEPADHLVVVRNGGQPAALRVDRALELVRLAEADVEDAGSIVPGITGLAGVARLADGLVLIADLGRLLAVVPGGAGGQLAFEARQVGDLPHGRKAASP